MEDDAPMYDNPAPVVYERAPSDGARDGGGPGGDDRRAAGGGAASASSAAAHDAGAFLRAAAAFASPGPWEAAFDPQAAGLLGPRAPASAPSAAAGATTATTTGKAAAETTTTKTATATTTKAATENATAAAAAGIGSRRRREPIDAGEIFDLVRDIKDPEHPYSLEQLGVVSRAAVRASDAKGVARVEVTPTVEHCSMATLIGLCVRARLEGALPPRFKVKVALAKGSHATEEAVNRQLADKERVAAAMENARLRAEVDRCLAA